MNNRETWISRFYIYTKDIQQFIEYCRRFQVIQNVKIDFVLDKEEVDDSIIYNDAFIADVTLYSELDSLRFINVFSLFFRGSKYCTRI